MEPWEIKTDDNRSSDTVTNFLLFCEGENSEPLYFKHFETLTTKVQINALGNWKSGLHHINKAIGHCKEKGMIEIVDGTPRIRPEITDNLWCVYDRDLESTELDEVSYHDDLIFTHSIQSAINAGLQVAWSNDAFEVWMLLHFEPIASGTKIHRNLIYQRLTEIFKDLQPRTQELNGITSNPAFNFKNFSKKRSNFITYIRPRLMERTKTAVDNAIKLEAIYSSGDLAFHDRNPCTSVHHLVQAILNASV